MEFQARGSPHAHNVIWIKSVPKFGHDSDENVCKFIDKYVTCSCAIPENECKLKELVLLLQQQQIVMYHRCWCKDAIICLKHGENVKPHQIFLSGPGGVSDSYAQLYKSGLLWIDELEIFGFLPYKFFPWEY